MAFNNVPVNGWPQIKDLEKLDALAKSIEDMPTFTSDDRAFLEDLPAYPTEDGTKVLTATTSNGETTLSYEDKSDLPADPQTDGVRVLVATTSDGETLKSWVSENTFLKTVGGKLVDCNTETTNGIIRVLANSTNMPSGASDGVLIVFRPATDNVCVQIFIESEGKINERINWYGTWSSWKVMAS